MLKNLGAKGHQVGKLLSKCWAQQELRLLLLLEKQKVMEKSDKLLLGRGEVKVVLQVIGLFVTVA